MYVYTRVYVCGFVMQVNIRLPMVTFFFSISLSLSLHSQYWTTVPSGNLILIFQVTNIERQISN